LRLLPQAGLRLTGRSRTRQRDAFALRQTRAWHALTQSHAQRGPCFALRCVHLAGFV